MVKKNNYLNIKHELVPTHYRGNPQFVNYVCINNQPVALYKNTDKLAKKLYKFKTYMILFKIDGKYLIGQLDKIQEEVTAVKCPVCKDVIYSCYRHDYNTCTCGKTSVDGGLDYLITNANKSGTLNLLTDTFKENNLGQNKKSKSIRKRIPSGRNTKTKKRDKKNSTRKTSVKS